MSHSCDGEPYQVYVSKTKRARVKHICSACRRTIRPGDYYRSTRTIFEGAADLIKRCGSCEVTFRHLAQLGMDADMFPDEKLNCGKSYRSEWDDDPPEEIASLPFLTDAEAGALLAKKTYPNDG